MSVCVLLVAQLAQANLITFDDIALAPDSALNGPVPGGLIVPGTYGDVVVGHYESGGAEFINRFDTTYGSWSGFAISNVTDNTTAGWTNQFSAIPGSGNGSGQDNYGIASGYRDVQPTVFGGEAFDPANLSHLQGLPHFTIPDGKAIVSAFFTNATYSYLSMKLGDSFTDAFGGLTGNEADWFKLSIYGTTAAGDILNDVVEFYLADYRFSDSSQDYIIDQWTQVNLGALSDAQTLYFNVSSSDSGIFGMNTPGYFAIDDIELADMPTVPEPSSLTLLLLGGVGCGVWRRRRTGIAQVSSVA